MQWLLFTHCVLNIKISVVQCVNLSVVPVGSVTHFGRKTYRPCPVSAFILLTGPLNLIIPILVKHRHRMTPILVKYPIPVECPVLSKIWPYKYIKFIIFTVSGPNGTRPICPPLFDTTESMVHELDD